MNWQIRVNDPSGGSRLFPLRPDIQGELSVGKDESCSIPLRDPKAEPRAITLWAAPDDQSGDSPYWFRSIPGTAPVRVGDLEVRECHWPEGIPLFLGESRLVLEPRVGNHSLPDRPSGLRPWLTWSEEGRKTLWIARKAAGTPLSLYLAGETGTGKEVLAQLIHAWSERAAGPFVPLHCGALALSLAESELFGHVKGAFTGAHHHRAGALMQAHNGTLFLDEVGDLPMDIQIKLLRFLENGEIRPVGSDRPSRADVRLLCATHHPLQKLVEEGKFRRDLYYRLASVTVEIPSLRSRPDDVAELARHFAGELKRAISSQAMLRLKAHSWPGNVRELRHAIERACGLSGPFVSVLNEDAFDFLLTTHSIAERPELELGAPILRLDEMERHLLLKALRLANGNRAAAARILGVARSTLFEMIRRHQIPGLRSGTSLLTAAEA